MPSNVSFRAEPSVNPTAEASGLRSEVRGPDASCADRHDSAPSYDVRVLKNVAELECVSPFWKELQVHPNANLEFFRILLATRPSVLGPNVLLLTQGGSPRALVLGRVENSRVAVKVGYLTLFQTRVRSLVVLHEGFLGDRSKEAGEVALHALMAQLQRGEADRIYLSNQRSASALLEAAYRLAPLLSRQLGLSETPHRSMTIPDESGGFIGRMKSKHRSWIKAKARELESRFPGTVRYVMFSKSSDLSVALADVEAVASKTYHRGLGVGFKQDAEHLQRFEMEAKAGRLRICVLYAGGEPRAYWIGFLYGEVFHSAFTGYEPNMRDRELGTLVFVHLVDQLSAERAKVFDFGLGDAFYKKRFADVSWTDASVSIYRLSLRGISLNILLGVSHFSEVALRAIAERFHVVAKIKRSWRSRLTGPKAGGTSQTA